MLTDVDSASSSYTLSTDLSLGSNARPTNIRFDRLKSHYSGPIFASQNTSKLHKKLHHCVCSERSLEIHESEKTCRKGKRAKWIVDLAVVYSITKRSNAKLPLCISLVNSEQTFFLRGLDEQGTHEWHHLFFSHVQTSRSLVPGRSINPRNFPAATWDVVVTPRPRFARNVPCKAPDLSTKENRVLGRKRLCFFEHSVVLLQMHTEPGELAQKLDNEHDDQNPDEFFFFPRLFISFYGCPRKFFFLTVSTSFYGTCEIYMDCGDPNTSTEIFTKFKALVPADAEAPCFPWQSKENDDEVSSTTQIKTSTGTANRRSSRAAESGSTDLIVPPAKVYCDENPQRRKEVRFEEAEQSATIQPHTCPESSSEDGRIGKAIIQDMVRLGTKRSINVGVPKKLNAPSNHTTLHGLIATLSRSFKRKPQPQSCDSDLRHVIEWAENRVSLASAEETEDSGGTLKVDETTSSHSDLSVAVPPTTETRRDNLLTSAIRRKCDLQRSEPTDEGEQIEMELLQRSTDSSNAASSGSYAGSVDSEVSDPPSASCDRPKHLGMTTTSSSAPDNLSASSSTSNVNESTWKSKRTSKRRNSPEGLPCSGRVALTTYEDTTSDGDSCYSSLSTNGYHHLPRVPSTSQLADETPDTPEEANPPPAEMANEKAEVEEVETPATSPTALKQIKSSNDVQKLDMEADTRERAASLGNKTWTAAPLGGKRQSGGISRESFAEAQPLLAGNRHSSVSSRSDCSFARASAVRAARLTNSMLRKNPAAFNTEDLAEMEFAHVETLPPVGASRASVESGSQTSESGSQRETVRVFVDSNRHLIPTTRYSDGSTSSARSGARWAHQQHRQHKGYELEIVRCFLNSNNTPTVSSLRSSQTTTPLAAQRTSRTSDSERTQRTTGGGESSTSSRESMSEIPRCRHGRVKSSPQSGSHRRHHVKREETNGEQRRSRCPRHSATRETITEEADDPPLISTQQPALVVLA